MPQTGKPIGSPDLVFREEFDDWAILFDPETGTGVGLNPVSAFIWKRLDGTHSIADILAEIQATFDNVPDEAALHLEQFVNDLHERGFIGYEVEEI